MARVYIGEAHLREPRTLKDHLTDTVLEHEPFLRELARALLGNGHDADEVAQQVWLDVLKRRVVLPRNPRPWLARVLRNKAVDYIRQNSSRRSREESAAEKRRDFDVGVDVDRTGVLEDIRQGVEDLPEPYRSTLRMRFYESHPPREISAMTGIPVNTVHTRIQRGLHALKRRLDERLGRKLWSGALLGFLVGDRALPPRRASTQSTGVAGFWNGASFATAIVLSAVLALTWVGGAWMQADSRTSQLAAKARDILPITLSETRDESGTRKSISTEPSLLSEADEISALSIAGRVMHADGSFAVGAEVWLNSGAQEDEVSERMPTSELIGYTDSEGRFRVQVEPGRLQLHVRLPGFVSSETLFVEEPPTSIEGVVFHMAVSRIIHGIVVDSDNRPVWKAVVHSAKGRSSAGTTYTNQAGVFYVNRSYVTTRTASDGTFTLDPISPALHRVIVEHDSYPSAKSSSAPHAREQLKITLQDPADVTLHVADELGNVVSGCKVEVLPASLSASAVEYEPGRHKVFGLPQGALFGLAIQGPEFSPFRSGILRAEPEGTSISVALEKAREFALLVRDQDGEAVEGVRVQARATTRYTAQNFAPRIVGLADQLSLREEVRTDSDGVARLAGLPRGPVDLELRTPGEQPQAYLFETTLEEDLLSISMADIPFATCVRGRLVDEAARAILTAGFVAARDNDQHHRTLAVPVKLGAYQLYLPESSSWEVLAYAQGFAPRLFPVDGRASGSSLDAVLVTATEGEFRVVDANGEPVGSSRVYLYGKSGRPVFTRFSGEYWRNWVGTDAEGRAQLCEVPATELQLEIFPPGLRTARTERLDLSSDQGQRTVRIPRPTPLGDTVLSVLLLDEEGSRFKGSYEAEIVDGRDRSVCAWSGEIAQGRAILDPQIESLYLRLMPSALDFRVWLGSYGRHDDFYSDGDWVDAERESFHVPLPYDDYRLLVKAHGYQPWESSVSRAALARNERLLARLKPEIGSR